ncbi:hypothetical protein [Micromonospora inositola]|nr:hypothetical protein [Micromonospora inositola]
MPERTADGGRWFDAGPQRTAVPYGFVVGPNSEFGIPGARVAYLHALVEG